MTTEDVPRRVLDQRCRNRIIEVVDTVACGADGLWEVGDVEFVDGFYDWVDEGQHWRDNSALTTDEIAAVADVQESMERMLATYGDLDMLPLIRSGAPDRVAEPATRCLQLLLTRGIFDEEQTESSPVNAPALCPWCGAAPSPAALVTAYRHGFAPAGLWPCDSCLAQGRARQQPHGWVGSGAWPFGSTVPAPARVRGIRPFSEIDEVDWAALSHPCSGASLPEVGRLLREAMTDGGENAFWGVVLHQGIVGEVTAHALPFVFGLLVDRPALRPVYVDWLVDTAWVFSGERAVEGEAAQAAVEAVRAVWRSAQIPLTALLSDPEPYIRAMTAGSLAEVDEIDVRVFAALEGLAQSETDPVVARDARLAVARAARDDVGPWFARTQAEAWLTSRDPEERVVGAHSLLWLDPGCQPAREHLLGLLPDGFGTSFYFGVGSVNTIVDDLCRSGLQGSELAVVLRALGRRGFIGDDDVIQRLLTHLFGTRETSWRLPLDERQRALLRRIADVPLEQRQGWATLVSRSRYELSVRGLPTDAEGLRRLAEEP